MKSLFDLSRIAALSIIAVLAGCGQKGPLYLPAKPAPAATPAPQPAPAPAGSTTPASK